MTLVVVKSDQSPNGGPDYGIDAPGLVRTFFLTAVAAVSAIFFVTFGPLTSSFWGILIGFASGVIAIYAFGMFCLMVVWSKFTKVRGRSAVLDHVAWSGRERVLDVGCGRGLMLVGAARRLTTGDAVGIDIWQTSDQSNNTQAGALRKASIEGVIERVSVETADMRQLPFPDESFDVVVSHWVVHNLVDQNDRIQALREMKRVLKVSGTLLLCDIQHRDMYTAVLRELGLSNCRAIYNRLADQILGAISFGSFRPTTIVATY